MSDLPAVIVGGYLGAGKTTLINNFLRDPNGLRATVLVNDFGAINIDADLIESHDGETIALTNGCACCSIGDDLIDAAQRTTQTNPKPDLVIVEASGVAQPGRLRTLLSGVAGLKIARTLTVINCAETESKLKDKFVGQLYHSQIAQADGISINRRAPDLDIGRISGNTATVDTLAEFIESNSTSFEDHQNGSSGDHANAIFDTRKITFDKPVSLSDLEQLINLELRTAERVKGVVEVFAESGIYTPLLVNATRTETQITEAVAGQRQITGHLISIGIQHTE